MEADFSGYATKAGLKCTDGRTITPEAFKHQDKMTVPLVWQHGHSDVKNVLGHAVLENRDESHPDGAGVYAYGFFNGTDQGKTGKSLVQHGDVTALSIFANGLVERAKQVLHGAIKEVSLVLSGANPGATIDFIALQHDGGEIEYLEDEAIITMGLALEHSAMPDEIEDIEDQTIEHADGDNLTVQEVYDSFTVIQKDVVAYMIGAAIDAADETAQHSDLGENATGQQVYDALSDQEKTIVHSMIDEAVEEAKAQAEHSALNNTEGEDMTRNVFEQNGATKEVRPTLSHDQIKNIVEDADSRLGSLAQSFLQHADEYGITDIDLLFPDATLDQNGVSFISRRMEWVNDVLTNTRHSPFSRVKSLTADITAEEARARGYVKGNLKKDEVIKMLRRVTTPKTIYKKQKLDRDDILDITDLDIVAWLKAEMRIMLDEEIARAVLIGDGREADDEDKIDEDHIRPVAYDIEMYTHKVNLASGITAADTVDAVVTSLNVYKGSGTPTLYTTQRLLTNMLLAKDGMGRRLYPTKADLANALLVKDVVAVEAMESETDLVGVIVNLADYTIGSDAGGNVNMFDDFDIDFNQQKYLIETRISGALTKPKSAIALFLDSGHIVTPTEPAFVPATGVITIPTQAGVEFHDADTNALLSAGALTALAAGATRNVAAVPVAGYGFTHDAEDEWSFTRDA